MNPVHMSAQPAGGQESSSLLNECSPRSLFEKYWCDLCQLPKGTLDSSFPYQCVHGKKKVHHEPIKPEPGETWATMKQTHIIPYPMNCEVTGVSSLVFNQTKTVIVGYCFLYEIDVGLDSYRQSTLNLVKFLAEHIANVTGSCIVRPSGKGWHFISLNVIPYDTFKRLGMECENIAVSEGIAQDHRYLVLRITKKPDEHLMPPSYQLHTSGRLLYPVSIWHKWIWEKVLQTKFKQHGRGHELLTSGMLVTYRC